MEAKRDAQGLIKALAFKDAAIRLAAVEALTPFKDPAAVEPLAGLLRDESPAIRRAAVTALAARGGFRVVEPLVSALEDRDPDVRATAATAVYRRLMADPDQETRRATAAALGRIRDASAVDPLVKALMDADEGVRVACVKALQAIGDVRAVPPLIVVLAHEQVRQKSTGHSSPAVERAASQALDTLCDATAIEPLQAALGHDDTEVRELAVRRLARIDSPAVADSLTASLKDKDASIRRAAARGLSEIGWKAPNDETGARYWVALREWRHAGECGKSAIPFLVTAFENEDALERAEIAAALAHLGWEPTDANASAANFWAAQSRWDKCIEMGEPSIAALDSILRSGPKWRQRVGAAGALATLDAPRSAPFARLDLVQQALAILDGEGTDDEKHEAFDKLLSEQSQFDPATGESVEWCACGYPASKVRVDGLREPLADLLGFETSSTSATTYYCPSCDTRRSTASG
ncbi:MAG: HEAT repeat domain-containing protein [Candidatus Limnocylindrales bacterium]